MDGVSSSYPSYLSYGGIPPRPPLAYPPYGTGSVGGIPYPPPPSPFYKTSEDSYNVQGLLTRTKVTLEGAQGLHQNSEKLLGLLKEMVAQQQKDKEDVSRRHKEIESLSEKNKTLSEQNLSIFENSLTFLQQNASLSSENRKLKKTNRKLEQKVEELEKRIAELDEEVRTLRSATPFSLPEVGEEYEPETSEKRQRVETDAYP